jgi:hypothetical protein
MAVSKSNKTEAEVKQPASKPLARQEIDRNRMIGLKNSTQGSLIYVSRQTGMQTHWSESGEIQYLPFSEIISMNGSQPVFLKYPWVLIIDEEDSDVVEFLGLVKFYETILSTEDVPALFASQPHEIEEKISKIPVGNKRIVAELARQAVENGTLDSVRVIKTLEKALDIDLSMIQN